MIGCVLASIAKMSPPFPVRRDDFVGNRDRLVEFGSVGRNAVCEATDPGVDRLSKQHQSHCDFVRDACREAGDHSAGDADLASG